MAPLRRGRGRWRSCSRGISRSRIWIRDRSTGWWRWRCWRGRAIRRSEADAVAAAHALDLSRAGDPAIRTDLVGKTASLVSAHPGVRAALLQFQRDFAARPVGESRGAVIDGRDIGTVICPDATAKLFVDARPETRANRRWKELQALGIAREQRHILEELIARDHADRNRPISPMKPAADAALLDTSDLSIDAAFAAALALVQPKVEAALRALPRG